MCISTKVENVSFTNWQTKDKLMGIMCSYISYPPINTSVFGTLYLCELVEGWQMTTQI